MEKVILLRYGEIYLKGKNRNFFEKKLILNIEASVSIIDSKVKIKKIGGRYLLYNFSQENINLLIDKIKKVFGLVSISVAIEIETDLNKIKQELINIIEKDNFKFINSKSFKIDVKRADKNFLIHSMELEKILGEIVLKKIEDIKVDLSNPELVVYVDIRENGKTYMYYDKINCLGGMPVGTSGNGLVMLSGGIDSPVASIMMAKRGMKLDAIHFHSFPYTSLQAKQKVIDLANIISNYIGEFNLYIVSFTKIQEAIHKNCKDNYMITIMRRIMMRICEKLSNKNKYQAIITGENLAQVASQTVESMTSTEEVLSKTPIFRPLIAFDKTEIIDLAKKFKTYDLSILPYEDCCTVFLPKNPLIKPKIDLVEKEEKKLNIDDLIKEALENMEILKIKP